MLVLGQEPVHPLTIVEAKAIGALTMRDDTGLDDKIIAVHVNDPAYADYRDIAQLPQHSLNELRRFFEDYKVLEHKQVVVEDFHHAARAVRIIQEAVERYRVTPGLRPA